jgi:ribokinase
VTARVLVCGSINTDLVVYVEKLPLPGETVSGGRFAVFPGGKGANQAVAAARAGAEVKFFGCLGDDEFGRERLASLAAEKVSTRGVVVKAGLASGIAQIVVDRNGENMIAVAPGANHSLDASDVRLIPCPPGQRCVALFQNEISLAATRSLLPAARDMGLTVLFNAAPSLRLGPEDTLLAAVDVLICNGLELEALAGGRGDVKALARRLLRRGAGRVLVTLGSEGALLVGPEAVLRQESFPVEALDSVGAGDCFCGVFAACLAAGREDRAALRRAAAAAAISVTRRGAQNSMPTAAEIEELL